MAKSKSYMAAYRTVLSATPPQGMTDTQLSSSIADTRAAYEREGERMIMLAQRIDEARWSPREGRSERVEAAQRAYNEVSDNYDVLRVRLGALEDERARRRLAAQPEVQRTFVNSFGEATRRNITSQSYENAQRRLNQRIDSWMRGR